MERWSVADVTLIIGDETGELYRYEKGTVRADSQVNIASASKLYTGLAVWSLIETGALSEETTPQDHIPFWTRDPADERSTVTIDHLLSFRSGFNSRPSLDSCPGDVSLSLEQCVRDIFDQDTVTVPGEAFAYGPDHMQIAALMARGATGQELSAVMEANIWTRANVSAATTFPNSSDNVRYSGGIRSTGEDYGKVLTELLAGRLVSTDTGFLTDRTNGSDTAYIIPAVEDLGLDWHYGFGFWIECDQVPFSADCATNPTISSPGAFGFLPWVDFETGYWAVLAMEEPITNSPRPSVAAVEFQQVIQPIIAGEF